MLDPIEAFGAIADHLLAFEGLLHAVLYVIGAVLILQSLRLAARRSEFGAQAATSGRIFSGFITGAAFLAFPATVSVLLASIFGSSEIAGPEMMFSIDNGTLDPLAGSAAGVGIDALVLVIRFVGFIAIARGLLFLNLAASPDGPRTLGPGFTFLIAGALAVNFPVFFGLMAGLFAG